MTNYQHIFEEKLNGLKQRGNYRYFLSVNKSARHFPTFYYEQDGEMKKAVNFCSNDYLGMSVEEEVISRFSYMAHQSGAGSGGTRNLSGTTQLHQSLEHTLANWHGKESALLFSGAYLANLCTLQTIGRHIPELVFISDERNHASIIEGMRSAGNSKIIFRHNDTAHLRQVLEALPENQPRMVVFESVYSMNGAIAPVKEILETAKAHHALTYIDEVHAIGLYGNSGAGICEQEGLLNEVDIINGTLAKAVGAMGGYIAASATLTDFIRSFGSGFIFTSSLPPALCAAAEKSIRLIQQSAQRRSEMKGLVTYLRRLLLEQEIPFTANESHITPIIIKGAKECRRVADALLQRYGLYVQPVNHPTVPLGEECLRVIVTARHKRKQVEYFVNSLKEVIHEEVPHHLQREPA